MKIAGSEKQQKIKKMLIATTIQQLKAKTVEVKQANSNATERKQELKVPTLALTYNLTFYFLKSVLFSSMKHKNEKPFRKFSWDGWAIKFEKLPPKHTPDNFSFTCTG